jgi:hypothetical protein
MLSITEGAAKGSSRTFAISQDRFLADGQAEKPLPAGARDDKGRLINRDLWVVPISVAIFGEDAKAPTVKRITLDKGMAAVRCSASPG